jgi:hypothetical protein
MSQQRRLKFSLPSSRPHPLVCLCATGDHAGRYTKPERSLSVKSTVKYQRIEFSWRAAFIGFYMTPERDKVWVTIVPFFPLYFKRQAQA